MILYLNTMCVLVGGLAVEVLAVFCLRISHYVIGNIIKETVGKADLWGVLALGRGPGQEPHQA